MKSKELEKYVKLTGRILCMIIGFPVFLVLIPLNIAYFGFETKDWYPEGFFND